MRFEVKQNSEIEWELFVITESGYKSSIWVLFSEDEPSLKDWSDALKSRSSSLLFLSQEVLK